MWKTSSGSSLYLFPRLYGGHVGVSLPLIVAVLKDFFHDFYKIRVTTYGPSQSQQDSNLILHITSGSLEADQRPPLLYRHWQVGELVKASCNIAHDRGNPTKNRTRIQASKIKTSNSKFIRDTKKKLRLKFVKLYKKNVKINSISFFKSSDYYGLSHCLSRLLSSYGIHGIPSTIFHLSLRVLVKSI